MADEPTNSSSEPYYYYQKTELYPKISIVKADASGIDWSQQATDSHLLNLSSNRILAEAQNLGLIKRRKT
jgi:hypothetical protein